MKIEIKNPMLYFNFINALQCELKKISPENDSKYNAVRFTVPDAKLRWMDRYNDLGTHFLNPKRSEIEGADIKLLEIVFDHADRLYERCIKSLASVYSVRDFEYAQVLFTGITGITDKQDICDKMFNLLINLCNNDIVADVCRECGLGNYLNSLVTDSELNQLELEYVYNDLFVCLSKLCCGIIYRSVNDTFPDKFDVKPGIKDLNDVLGDEYMRIKEHIKISNDIDSKINLYNDMYRLITENVITKDSLNYIANALYEEFFTFVNDLQIQDEHLLLNSSALDDIIKLYNILDIEVKYTLYRNYRDPSIVSRGDSAGLMRHSLVDRKIVLDFLKSKENDPNYEQRFKRAILGDNEKTFVLRQARFDDLRQIWVLNNPPVPYRRAIYVKSDENEIIQGIANKEIYIIENVSNGQRQLACFAMILNGEVDHSNFNTDSLCQKYAEKFIKIFKRDPKYLDFDAVITNNGESSLGSESYRGYGFQRLMLVLTEELALMKDCDYVSATVSTFNAPSKRNFQLSGYMKRDHTLYSLKPGEQSNYWYYIQEKSDEEKRNYSEKISKELSSLDESTGKTFSEILIDMGISEEAYRIDRDVPRDFLVLNLKNLDLP